MMKPIGIMLCALVVGAGLLDAGCAARQESTRWTSEMLERGPGPLVAIDAQWPDSFMEQQVEIDWGDDSQSFRAVLQKQGELLELILLDPMGRPGFRLFQAGTSVGVENFSQRTLPFEAAYILADVQKAFGPWLAPETDNVDGATRSFCTDGLCLREEREGARLLSRQFTRDDVSAEEIVDVRYHYDDGGTVPSKVVLTNDWFAYVLRIDVRQWQAL